ncbi:MAG: precorrin-4 C(11)-methyltransferase [Dethiobacteria bacterium]
MVYFVGAGSGATDLITIRGLKCLKQADVIIYAGSLVNPALLEYARDDCSIYNSAEMTLEQVLQAMQEAEAAGLTTVRLHSGDPCLYGAIREQMDLLDENGISYEVVPGVSSFCGAAAALRAEYTLPGVSQSVVITRMAGRTPVPKRESIRSFAEHGCTMVIFLSAGMTGDLQSELLAGGFAPETPAAIVYKATWPDEKTVRCTVGTLPQAAEQNEIGRTALILVGKFLGYQYDRSRLYDPSFSTSFRRGNKP